MIYEIRTSGLESHDGLEAVAQYLKSAPGCSKVTALKLNKKEMSLHDAISFVVDNKEVLGAIAAGLGLLLAKLGDRSKVEFLEDGRVIVEKVSSKDAAKIVRDLSNAKKPDPPKKSDPPKKPPSKTK